MTEKSKAILNAFLVELTSRGVQAEKIEGTNLYMLDGAVSSLIYVKVKAEDAPFFGLRCDFVQCLNGGASGLLPREARSYVAWLISDQNGEEPELPAGWNRKKVPIIRRVLAAVKSRKSWGIVFLLGRRDAQICDGWVLGSEEVRKGMRQWRLSPSQGEFKIDKSHLDFPSRKRSLVSVVSVALEFLTRPAPEAPISAP